MADGEPEVRQKFIEQPKAKALTIDKVPGGAAVVDAASDDPVKRFGINNKDIEFVVDLRPLLKIMRESPSFKKMEETLKKKKIAVEHEVKPLPTESGGGSTSGGAKSPVRIITLWQQVIPKDFHILDVFIHEYGHVYEDHGGPDYQTFVNQVQKEIGIRQTPDSHKRQPPKAAEQEPRTVPILP
jgi:hypothetical protein